ncbi:tail tape measure protein [Sphingomonas sp. MAH-20]|uniref:Tail tape measure protein n=1 Tax=Sphingomonas horti TaxID=2682842 RepID=A0A6I4J0X7_9SPHN|nr:MULTISPECIES: tail tape measure protein [Sphingomonas]MBA2920046.1 tail tape measure protein [Sphingomonas sp. CGMCC 1.13658]MVO77926.1 tail tape measure protein [Sphingomonas horti]
MDEEIERLVVSVRADTQDFARDVAAMRAELEGPFGIGIDRAGRALETGLARAIRSGKLGFEDLGRVAQSVLASIAASAVRSGVSSILSGVGAVLDLPGRATGGPVAPGRAYMVGERGPELFVPSSAGQVMASAPAAAREVRVTVNVNAPAGADGAKALVRSSRQVARAVRRAMEG